MSVTAEGKVPRRAGRYWVKVPNWTDEDQRWRALATVEGESPLLEVTRIIDLIGDRIIFPGQIEEWGPEFEFPGEWSNE